MTSAEEIAMLKAEVEDLRLRLARYEGMSRPSIGYTPVGVCGPLPKAPTGGSGVSGRRKRRGPLTLQHPGDSPSCVQVGTAEELLASYRRVSDVNPC